MKPASFPHRLQLRPSVVSRRINGHAHAVVHFSGKAVSLMGYSGTVITLKYLQMIMYDIM